tara:strand:+ start:224 stop:745 length:522 start_codon:yes stop_codon:yes gene_type:complete
MNRNDMKEWFRVFKQAQQDEFFGKKSKKQSHMLNETIKPTIHQIRDATYELGTQDPGQISTYLGAHEDEVYDMMQGDAESTQEDVAEMARYHALNNDVDATLYRDNPDYREAFIEMIVTNSSGTGRPHLDHGGLEAEEDALDALRNPAYDEDTEDDFSPEYRQMINKGRFYDK